MSTEDLDRIGKVRESCHRVIVERAGYSVMRKMDVWNSEHLPVKVWRRFQVAVSFPDKSAPCVWVLRKL